MVCRGAVAGDRDAAMMPMPARVEFIKGALPIGRKFSVSITGSADPRLRRGVQRFVDHLSTYAGTDIRLVFVDESTDSDLHVRCRRVAEPNPSFRADESYTLEVGTRQIVLKAQTALGVLRGFATLEQCAYRTGNDLLFHRVRVDDRPRFPWRGLLIDVCRHWQPMSVIKRNLDAMAAVKLNVLHLHLTEDQGFRVESKRFPRLQEAGSDGNYFTQDELREIVAYARDRGIRVVPEFDMPGHTGSWLVGMPELAAGAGPFEIARRWGVFDPCFDPTKESLYEFLDAFFEEMATVFPDRFVHIGGDEVNGRAWSKSPRIQAFMKENGLAERVALQAYFNGRVASILARHGRTMIGWDEILRGDVPAGAIVQSWRGLDGLRDTATRGFGAILSNGYYLDHQMSAAFHYANDPGRAMATLDAKARARVLGGEACMWGEYVSPETIDSRVWPRLAAIAERLWSPASVNDIDDMYRRLENVSLQLDKLGLQHRANYPRMLKRLAGDGAVEPVRVLADIVEPVKLYQRSGAREYTTATPLNRLVDATRPESSTARRFQADVRNFLSAKRGAPEARAAVIRSLTIWRENHGAVLPVIRGSSLLSEVEPVSLHLREIAAVGLSAVKMIDAGQEPEATWYARVSKLLDAKEKAVAEVTIAVIPAIRELVHAAGSQD